MPWTRSSIIRRSLSESEQGFRHFVAGKGNVNKQMSLSARVSLMSHQRHASRKAAAAARCLASYAAHSGGAFLGGVFDLYGDNRSHRYFAQALYLLSLFVLAVLLGRLLHLGRCYPFKFAWWSVSFPLVSASIAALHYAETISGAIADTLALALLALATVVVAGMLVRTLVGLLRGELRTLSA